MSNTEYYKSEINRYRKMLEDEKRNDQIKEAIEELHKIYAACIAAGFSEEQAWYFTKAIFAQALYA